MADGARVAPELLRYVDDYIDETDINEAVKSDALFSGSNLLVFYRELFAQLFANVLGERITAISARSGEQARRLYDRQHPRWPEPLRALVRDFQHLCKLYPDLLGEEYGGGNEAITSLHFELLPGLLHDLERWAREEREPPLAEATAASRRRYGEFMDEFEPG